MSARPIPKGRLYAEHYTLPAYQTALPQGANGPVRPGTIRLPAWSGESAPPPIGAKVLVRVNQIGACEVVCYFTEHGFLGLKVMPLNPPEWYLEQNGRSACHVFGAECKVLP